MTKNQRNTLRAMGAFTIIIGGADLWLAHYGSLWQSPMVEYLGWSQLYVLRPALYLFGLAGVLVGFHYLWFRWTNAGYVLREWLAAVQYDRELDEQFIAAFGEDAVTRATWRDELAGLWALRYCLIGQHSHTWYSDGGEDGPRGTYCGCCDAYVSIRNLTVKEAPDNVVELWPELETRPDPLLRGGIHCDKEA